MSAPRAGFCIACERFAGAQAGTCPYCGESVAHPRGWHGLRLATPLAAAGALVLASLGHATGAESILARLRLAAGTPCGGVLLALAAGLALLPPRLPDGPPQAGDAAWLDRWRVLGNVALGAACTSWGALLPGSFEPARWGALAVALTALALLPRLHALNYAALSPLVLVPAALWIQTAPVPC